MKEDLQERKWQVLESEYLLKRPWLTARRDRVLLPTGVELPEYYVLEYPDWVNTIAITRDGRFVTATDWERHVTSCVPECANRVSNRWKAPAGNCWKRRGSAEDIGRSLWLSRPTPAP